MLGQIPRLKYQQAPLPVKISLPLILVFLGFWTASTIIGTQYFSRKLDQKQRERAEDLAALVDREVSKELIRLKREARLLAKDLTIIQATANQDVNALQQNFLPLKATLNTDILSVIDPEQNRLIDVRQNEYQSAWFRDSTILDLTLTGADLATIVPADGVEAPIVSPPILVGTAPVKNNEGIVGGMILGLVVDYRFLKQINRIIEEQIVVLYKGEVIDSTTPVSLETQRWLRRCFTTEATMDQNQEFVAQKINLESLDGSQFGIVLLISRQSLERSKQIVWLFMSLLAILGSFLTMVIGYLIAQRIARPIQDMTAVAQRVTQDNNFDVKVPFEGKDEVGILAKSFNQLIHQVKTLLTEQVAKTEALAQTNQQLTATQKQMVAQEKLASLGSLTAGIAHEIKNPLNFINNFAALSVELSDELVEELETRKEKLDPELVEELMEIIELIKANTSKINSHGKRADKIIANMLLHARSQPSSLTEVDINGTLADTINLAYHGLRAKRSDFNLSFDTHYDDTIGPITVYAQDINRALLNISSNACYAIYQRQLAKEPGFNPTLTVKTQNLGDRVEIRIQDNGLGMTPEVLERIFDQFFTTKPPGEGTGLGLSLTYDIIVGQHRGSLDVESEHGIGSVFILNLPKQTVKLT